MAGQMVSFARNGEQTDGYLAQPDDGATHPGVVVIQEWWGLEQHIKDVADRFAGEGFVALAPDLYHGAVTSEPDEARKLAMGLDRKRAAQDLDGAVACLCGMAQVAPKKVGVVGFCMGGGLTLLMACRNADLGAAAVFYGGSIGSTEQLKQLHCPLFGAFGERDQGIPLERVEALKNGLQQSGQPVEIQIYAGAPHAFFNDTRPSYRPAAADDAWQRTLALFRRQLA